MIARVSWWVVLLAGMTAVSWAARDAAAPQVPARPARQGNPPPAAPSLVLLDPGKPIDQVVGGLLFADGAAGDGEGNVYLVDAPAGRILRWSTAGRLSILRDGAAGPSGLCVAPNGDVVACERRGRCVTATDSGGYARMLADACRGEKLNSPRCAWVDPRGGVYFTDPRLTPPEGGDRGAENVYYLAPETAEPVPVIQDLRHPGAVTGTPDGGRLYVSDIGANQTWEFQVQAGGRLGARRLFANVPAVGITLDERGNVYLVAMSVRVYAPTGAFIEELRVPGTPSSVAFGGPEGRTLFVTVNSRTPAMGGAPGKFETQGGLYALPTKVRGAVAARAPSPSP